MYIRAAIAGKCHFQKRNNKAAIASVVIRQNQISLNKLLNCIKRTTGNFCINIRTFVPPLIVALAQNRSARPVFSKTKINQKITSEVLQFFTEDGTKISVRPSGTEPKIKFYFELAGSLTNRADYDAVEKLADEKIDAIMKELDL